MFILIGRPFPAQVAAGYDFGGAGFAVGRVKVCDGGSQFGTGMAFVRPVLMPALLAGETGDFVAHLAVVKVDVRTEQIDHDADDAGFGELVEPVVTHKRLVHNSLHVAGVEIVRLETLGGVGIVDADGLGKTFLLCHQPVEVAPHLSHVAGVVEAF